jgi:predicted deacylase
MTQEEKKLLPYVVIVISLIILVIAGYFYFSSKKQNVPSIIVEETITTSITDEKLPPNRTIGTSVEGRDIESYTYGTGDTTLLFVGGIHGGYEWNSVLLAYEFIDELEAGLIEIPDSLSIEVIPVLNPDGLYSIVKKEGRFTTIDIPRDDLPPTGQGRFNANEVDLNRNFDCKWKPTSTWRSKVVSAGDSAFSEPEAIALKGLIEEKNPTAVVFWHSQANAVYASECTEGVLPETLTLMNTYADSAEYRAVASFDAYPVSGDAEGWLASIGIPAVTVELSSHEAVEWERNKAGVESLIDLYSIAK